jgi:hypothetical protein
MGRPRKYSDELRRRAPHALAGGGDVPNESGRRSARSMVPREGRRRRGRSTTRGTDRDPASVDVELPVQWARRVYKKLRNESSPRFDIAGGAR